MSGRRSAVLVAMLALVLARRARSAGTLLVVGVLPRVVTSTGVDRPILAATVGAALLMRSRRFAGAVP